jgi:hypothetical protein
MTSNDAILSVPPTEQTRSRRFGLSDSMVSIGGIALVLTYGRYEFVSLFWQIVYLCRAIAAYFGFISWGRSPFLMKDMANFWSSVLWHGIQVSELLVLIMTPVFLLMRLRRPRPSFRTLLKQPGAVAGIAVALGLIWVTGWLHYLFFGRINSGTVNAIAVGGTVALAWACLALSRKWEAESSWIDRMGRLLGATAIAVGLLALMKFGI